MKVIINGVEIEIIGGSRLTYDSHGDTLSVDPIESPRKNNFQKTIEHDPNDNPIKPRGKYKTKPKKGSSLTQEELRKKIIDFLSPKTDWSGQQWITRSCLGLFSSTAEKKYLKIMLDDMVQEKILSYSIETGKSRYKIYAE